jgi:hypothetical protein
MKTVLGSQVWRRASETLRKGLYIAAAISVTVVGQPGSSALAANESGNGDDFLVVDCLLPGKVRRLGTRVTYVTTRKAVKTTASECAIRGGEYTSADRASFTTALKTWLPLANEGDPVAQTYVGEIYEKGLGVSPEYKLAAQWYGKAAEQNYARAQLNLGALYEKGLGVAKDKAQAVSWYRRASGMTEGSVPYIPAEAAAEIKQLKEDKKALEAERDKLRQELDANRVKLNSAESQYEQSEKNTKAARAALAAAQKTLEADVAAGRQDRILKISMDLANRSRELAEREGEASQLREQVASLQKESSSLESALSSEKAGREQDTVRYEEVAERYRAEAATARAATQKLKDNLSRADRELKKVRISETQQRKRADAEREQVATLNADLAKQQRLIQESEKQEADLNQELANRRKALNQSAQTQDRIRLREESARRKKAESQVAALQASLKEQKLSAERENAREAELQRRLALQKDVVATERAKSAALDAQNKALADKSADLARESTRRKATEAIVGALLKDLAKQKQAAKREREREVVLQRQISAEQDKASSQSAARQKEAEEHIAALIADLARQKEAAARERAQEAALQQQLGQQQGALKTAQTQADALKAELSTLQEQTDQLRDEAKKRKAAEAIVSALLQDLAKQKQAAKRERSRENELNAQLVAQREALVAAREKSTALESKAARLERSEKNRKATQAQVADLQARLDQQKKQAYENAKRATQLKKQLATRRKALETARKQATALASRTAALKAETTLLKQEQEKRADAAKQLAAAPPDIEIIEPQLPTTRSTGLPVVMAKGGDNKVIIGRINAPIGIMSLMVNDQEQKVGDGGLFRMTVPLSEAKTNISVVAIDTAGRRAAMAFTIERNVAVRNLSGDAPQLTARKLDVNFGKYHAIVIGNNDYAELTKLETAVGDAEAVAELLETRYGFKVTLLRNANRYDILSAFNKLREELTEDDNLLIYYAGHGELDRVNNRGHWLPVDAEPDSTANWISNIQVTDVLNAMSVKHLLVVADSCYSGTLTRAAVARLDSGMSESTRANWIKLMAEKRARLVLSSGGVQPVLDSGGGGHSVFASAFLKALGANTQILEGQRLFSRVSESVTSVREAAEIDQIPQYAPIKYAGHEAGDFFFVPVTN